MEGYEVFFGGLIIFMICLSCFAVYAWSQQHTVTYVGIVEKVKVNNYDVTIILDTDVVQVHLVDSQFLQVPLQVGHKYQIDVQHGLIGYDVLTSITELPLQ